MSESRRPASCVELLRSMVQFDTVNAAISGRPDAERELAMWLEGVARCMGFETRRLPVRGESFNLLVSLEAAPAAPWLLFESHLDTVSVDGMTVAPHGALVTDGRVYGRGACDTKGTGAAMLWALSLAAAGGDCPNNLAVLYTIDEEISKTGVRAFVESQLDTLGWRPAGAVCGEPTELLPVVAHNGVMRWTIETHGVAAHSCEPSAGRSAISMMVRVVDALERSYIPSLGASHPLTGKAQGSINVIEGGVQANIIPERCAITVERRLVPGEDWRDVQPAVESELDALRAARPELRVEQRPPYATPPLDPATGGGFADHVVRVLSDLGLPSTPSGAQYCTDASDLAGAGIPAVVLGPGDIAQAHTHDEWLEIASLERGVEAYLGLMRAPLSLEG